MGRGADDLDRRCFVRRVALNDFRSYIDGVVELDSSLIVVSGANGAGKTNLIEALSLLSPGRGLRGVTCAELARDGGSGSWSVSAELLLSEPVVVGTGTEASSPERRQVRINGEAVPVGALAEWLSVMWLTPAMDRIFIEGPAGRRRFLDRLTLAIAPDHAHHSSRFEAAMRSRNRLLDDPDADQAWIGALEQQMASHGVRIAAARLKAIDGLTLALAELPPGPAMQATLSAEGWLESRVASEGEDRSIVAYGRELAQRRSIDAAAGRTLVGPHRSDLAVIHTDKQQPAARCSTGEQKALLLGIVLAQAKISVERRGKPSLLLLDEVAAHLDASRRATLLESLTLVDSQVWLTGTDAALFEPVAGLATHIVVSDGHLAISRG